MFALWNAFTLAGAVLGDALGDPTRYGLDAAAAAAFLALLWPRLAGRLARVTAAAALLVALALTPLVPAGIPVLAAAVVAVVVGWTSPGPIANGGPGPPPPDPEPPGEPRRRDLARDPRGLRGLLRGSSSSATSSPSTGSPRRASPGRRRS